MTAVPNAIMAFQPGDPVRVRQILTNYLSNALKFTPRGHVEVAAEVAASGQVRLSVSDTGIGIEQHVLARLFTPFTQADESITREFGGSGLGLSICHELARRMGGSAGAQSTPGQGSTFWAELPLPAAPPVLALEAGATPAAAGAATDLTGLRVLLVEDNQVNVMIADAMLCQWGVEVLTAGDGREALEVVEREHGHLDLVLMDLHMPVMSGWEATEILRTRYTPEALPIVAFTAAALGQERERSEALGMNAFLTKPFDPERLRAIVAECTGRAGTGLRSAPRSGCRRPGAACAYCANQPPSTLNAAPRMLSAAGEHKKIASSPNCAGVVNCSDGCFSASRRRLASAPSMPSLATRASSCCCTSGVSTQPGQMALTVMPLVAVSSATALVKPTRPCLEAT